MYEGQAAGRTPWWIQNIVRKKTTDPLLRLHCDETCRPPDSTETSFGAERCNKMNSFNAIIRDLVDVWTGTAQRCAGE